MHKQFEIKPAELKDKSIVLSFIKQLAEYEKLALTVTATEELIAEHLFGKNAVAECVIGYFENKPVTFALFFKNFSTFVGKPGLYLEDLFVLPEYRGFGFGKKMLLYLVKLAKERNYGRFEWTVLNWNTPAKNFYVKIGAELMEEWQIFRITEDKFEKCLENE
jgi:GNAT superfamily N-acetyltransferase